MFPVVHNVVFQHAENAAFLWSQRMDATHHPDYHFADLKQLDDKVSANLRGLSVAGAASRDIVEQLLGSEEEGALFTYLVLLIEQSPTSVLIDKISGIDLAAHYDELKQAVAWVNPKYLAPVSKMLVEEQQESVLLLGLTAHLAHRKLPQASVLSKSLVHSSLNVRMAALDIIATLRLDRHVGEISTMLCDVEEQNMAVARAQLYTDQRKEAQQTLRQLQSSDHYRYEALSLLMLTLSPGKAREWLKPLFDKKERILDVIRGFGVIGDPSAVPWLIEQTADEQLARQAGAAIAMITGIDLALEDLDRTQIEEEPDDEDPDAPIAEDDPDDDLAWPDTDRLRQWWRANNRWHSGQVYLMGKRADEIAELDKVLSLGTQPHRSIAAARRALLLPREPVFDQVAPAHLQSSWMFMRCS